MKAEKPNSTSAPRASEAAALVQVGGNLGGADPEGVSVDKIRDLLFGNQMQDYDRRFANLEERFLQRFKEIESETSRNLGAFESNAKKQVDSLAAQLREEKDQRADADKEIEHLLRESSTRRWKNVYGRCRISSISSIVTCPIASRAKHRRCAKRSSRRTRTLGR
jgi:hypothetical protein